MNGAQKARTPRGPWLQCVAMLLLVGASPPALAGHGTPARAGAVASAKSPSAAATASASAARVELNSADVDELCTLPGIGPKKAEAIIAYREQRRFTRVTQLLRIRGIGVKTLERLRPLIYVAPVQRTRPKPKPKPKPKPDVAEAGKAKPAAPLAVIGVVTRDEAPRQ